MNLLGKSNIIKHKAKLETTYPLVRFLQPEAGFAGETAHIFKTEYNGKPVYVISLEDELTVNLKLHNQK